MEVKLKMRIKMGQHLGDTGPDEVAYRRMYGNHARISRLGKITVVHLDNPSEETIRKRVEEAIREEMAGEAFEDDCLLCQELKDSPYEVVYEDCGDHRERQKGKAKSDVL